MNIDLIKSFLIFYIIFISVSNLLFAQDGLIDNTFGDNGFTSTVPNAYNFPTSIAIQKDKKIIIGGYCYDNNSNSSWFLTRYYSDGNLDAGFGTEGIVTKSFYHTNLSLDYCTDILLQPDGKILAGGYSYNDFTGYDFTLVRYNTNGSLDDSFGENGVVRTNISNYSNKSDWGYSIAIQSDGKIIMGGYCEYHLDSNPQVGYYGCLVRYTTDGKLDNSFANNGIKIIEVMNLGDGYGSIQAIGINFDGKIIAAGYYDNVINNRWNRSYLLLKFNSDGELDSSFSYDGKVITNLGSILGNYNGSMIIQPDDKIIFSGSVQDSAGRYNFILAKYNKDGSLDNSFGAGGISKLIEGECYKIVQQPDGKVISVGLLAPNGSVLGSGIVRYNTDGSLDKTFGIDGISYISYSDQTKPGFYSWNAASILGDGKLVVSGIQYTNSSYYPVVLARYNAFSVIKVSNKELNFGNVILGNSSKNSFLIYNKGSDTLKILSIESDGSEFIVEGLKNFNILPMDSQNVEVKFKPEQIRNYNGLLRVDYNEPGNLISLNLSGNGIADSLAIIILDSTNLNFGNVTVNDSSVRNIFIKNKGIDTLKVINIISDNSSFIIDGLTAFDITPKDSQIVNIIFKPSQIQNYSAKIKIKHNGLGPSDSINLTGNGIGEKIPGINFSRTSLSFGSIAVNDSLRKSFYIKNVGTDTLIILNIISDSSAFVLNGLSNLKIAPKDSQIVDVNFKPVQNRYYTGTIRITHNASGSPSNINLSGTGVLNTAIIKLSIESLKFDSVTINSFLKKSFYIKNDGTDTLKISDIIIDSTAFSFIGSKSFTVAPKDSHTVEIKFSPVQKRSYIGELRI